VRRGIDHAADKRAHGVTGASVQAHPSECRQRQHRAAPLRVGLDQQVPTVAVSKRQLGQADDEVPFVPASPILQSGDSGGDILRPNCERLAHNLDVPVAVPAGRWSEVS